MMLSFDDFEAKVPRDVDFRPALRQVMLRYASNSSTARENFRGADGYVFANARALTRNARQPIRQRSEGVDLALDDPIRYYQKKASDLRHSDPSKRGSRRVATAILYWFFREVSEPSYFKEIAPKVWPTTSEVFKRMIYAKCGSSKCSSFLEISERFRAPIVIIEDGFRNLWYEDFFTSTTDLARRAGLDPDGEVEAVARTPNLGLEFYQAGKQMTAFTHNVERGRPNDGKRLTTLVPLRAENFSIARPKSLSSSDEIPNIMFSIQTDSKAHDEIENARGYYNVPNSSRIFEGVKLSIGDGIADYTYGSAQKFADDRIGVREIKYGGGTTTIVDLVWNVTSTDRLRLDGTNKYALDIDRISDRTSHEDYLKTDQVLYFTFADFYNDPLLGKPRNNDKLDKTMFNTQRIERVIILFH